MRSAPGRVNQWTQPLGRVDPETQVNCLVSSRPHLSRYTSRPPRVLNGTYRPSCLLHCRQHVESVPSRALQSATKQIQELEGKPFYTKLFWWVNLPKLIWLERLIRRNTPAYSGRHFFYRMGGWGITLGCGFNRWINQRIRRHGAPPASRSAARWCSGPSRSWRRRGGPGASPTRTPPSPFLPHSPLSSPLLFTAFV